MQRILSPGLVCRIRGVDRSGFKILTELRKKHLRRVLFLPALLKDWHQKLPIEKLMKQNEDPMEEPEEMPSAVKETMRLALGIYAKKKLMQMDEPISIRALSKKQKLFTVLKSPHIDKKAREQFFFTTYGVELSMKTSSIPTLLVTEILTRFYETGSNELHITVRF